MTEEKGRGMREMKRKQARQIREEIRVEESGRERD